MALYDQIREYVAKAQAALDFVLRHGKAYGAFAFIVGVIFALIGLYAGALLMILAGMAIYLFRKKAYAQGNSD